MSPKILILVPHSQCDASEEIRKTYKDGRVCDTRAEEEARKLFHIAEKTHDVEMFTTTVLRKDCDGNREIFSDGVCMGIKDHDMSGTTQVLSECCVDRKKITDYLDKNKSEEIIIFEMHSFPNDTKEFSGSQMALLAIDEYYPTTKPLLDHLRNDIRAHSNINRTRVNNLMITSSKYPNIKHHFLLEFNEDKETLPDSKLNDILDKIFVWSILSYRLKIHNLILSVVCIIALIFLFYLYQKKITNIKALSRIKK